MTRTTVTRTIEAAPEVVFRAVSDIRNLPEVVPNVQSVEVLSESEAGVGTRFRETRSMKGRESVTELEVTELVPSERVRMVADSHGTIWDSTFTVTPAGERTELALVMDARAQKLLPKLLNPIMRGLIQKGLERHMDDVKSYCERAH